MDKLNKIILITCYISIIISLFGCRIVESVGEAVGIVKREENSIAKQEQPNKYKAPDGGEAFLGRMLLYCIILSILLFGIRLGIKWRFSNKNNP